MDLETFHSLPRDEVAQLVREAGPKVCVFPIKGTRRWLMLEYPSLSREEFATKYVEVATKRSIEIYRLFFDHGIDTLLVPIFDMPLMERGVGYMQMATEVIRRMAMHPDFVDFYGAYAVRVRFYGAYRKVLGETPYAYLADYFDEITTRTQNHTRRRLFFGVFAGNGAEAVAQLTVQYYTEHGCVPDKRALCAMYYGEDVEQADMFIGFGKLRVFDIPLLTAGREDLYFTVSPSLYLTEPQLRDILYDHLYRRGRTKANLLSENWKSVACFYKMNVGNTLGVGSRQCGIWYPIPQVYLPPQAKGLVSGGDESLS
jgi:tuberculosinol/isotuberculosinol synthase